MAWWRAVREVFRYAWRRLRPRLQRHRKLAIILEVPADFSRRALPGEAARAARLTIYTSDGK